MTENKRFEMIITGADDSFHYLDKNTGEKIISTLELENKLNALHEENEQLETKNNAYLQDIEMFKEENTTLKLENEQLKNNIGEQGVKLDFAICETQDFINKWLKLKKENEQLKAQLRKGEDVCSICKHQYLTKRDNDKYYIAKCKKEHIECSKDNVNYCEDFKCKELKE